MIQPATGRLWYSLVMAAMLLPATALRAQLSTDYLKAANQYFARADFASAAAYYEKYLHGAKADSKKATDPYAVTTTQAQAVVSGSRLAATYQLAESYRRLTDVAKATPLYQQLYAADANAYPLALYYYATGLRAQAHYLEAEQAFQQFLQNYTLKDTYRQAAERELANLAFVRTQLAKKDTGLYTITRLTAAKEGASYAPVMLNANTLLFTATWQEGAVNHVNRLYQAAYGEGGLTQATPAALPEADKHQGAAAMSEDGHTLYFTAWNIRKGKKEAAIYVSHLTGDSWSKPAAMDSLVNKPGYQAQQPLLLPGSKNLLYVSDRPDGYGGYDIWCAETDDNGHTKKVTNLGSTINTAGNEQAPYYYAPGATLVFATDGRTGMGGYDLFYSKGNVGDWSSPVNFGYPVNSVKDDMYFASLGKGADDMLQHALLSSDRSAACCLELLAVHTALPASPVAAAPVSVAVPEATPVPVDTTHVQPVFTARILEHVYYTLNSADLQPASFAALDKLVDTLRRYPQLVVEIGGHTDNTGSENWNQLLSQRRADNVAAYLVKQGIDKSRILSRGYGATMPLAPNTKPDGTDNPEGREQNRRTELKILKQ